ncbi:MAG: DUF2853 family protein [Pseudomonadota bacterium]
MSKREELIEKYTKQMEEKIGLKVDKALLAGVTKACGPSIYNKDSSQVAASDTKELDRIKKNFLIKKLELKDTPKLDEGIKAVIETYGKSTRPKYRAVFYYLLAKQFRKSAAFK